MHGGRQSVKQISLKRVIQKYPIDQWVQKVGIHQTTKLLTQQILFHLATTPKVGKLNSHWSRQILRVHIWKCTKIVESKKYMPQITPWDNISKYLP